MQEVMSRNCICASYSLKNTAHALQVQVHACIWDLCPAPKRSNCIYCTATGQVEQPVLTCTSATCSHQGTKSPSSDGRPHTTWSRRCRSCAGWACMQSESQIAVLTGWPNHHAPCRYRGKSTGCICSHHPSQSWPKKQTKQCQCRKALVSMDGAHDNPIDNSAQPHWKYLQLFLAQVPCKLQQHGLDELKITSCHWFQSRPQRTRIHLHDPAG